MNISDCLLCLKLPESGSNILVEQQIHQMLKKPLHLISKFGLGFRANRDLDPNPDATTQFLSHYDG